MNAKYLIVHLLLVLVFLLIACRDDDMIVQDGDLTHIPFQAENYEVKIPPGWPQMEIPDDNPLTQEGVHLGRRLFFDPILSLDSTISCSTCHIPEKGFSDDLPKAVGINGAIGDRKSMSLINVGFVNSGLFWDGRVSSLEEQALHPIENPLEMNSSLEEVERKLREHEDYAIRFRKAFGINNRSEINRDLLAKALAQFQRIIIAGENSTFEQVMRGEKFFDDDEFLGWEMFFDANLLSLDAECAHCHISPLFTTNEFINNGTNPAENLKDYSDLGRGAITGDSLDNAKFRVPTLYNWELRNHFMHDGQFKTMEEVVAHYNSGGHRPSDPDQDNVDLLLYPLGMNEEEKAHLMAFLKTLTDTTFLENPDLQDPFQP